MSQENSKTRRRTQEKNPQTQVEDLREESQRVKHNTKTLGRGERKNPEICEPHEANWEVRVCDIMRKCALFI